MKTILSFQALFFYLICLCLSSCSKDINEASLPLYQPTTVDSKGGSWQLVYFDARPDVPLLQPSDVTSESYQNELQRIIALQRNASEADRNNVKKWSANSIIIWNAIARNLVAKYNLAPEANEDGTYPVPSSANPGNIPLFPFANPPYSCRAYAYLQTAIYDALVLCTHYQYQYQRQAPHYNNTTITTTHTAISTPSYPSSEAVVASVAKKMLSVLFPNDTVYLTQQANAHQQAQLYDGQASYSDIEAAEVIAQVVTQKAIARLKTDKMGLAVGNATQWDSLYHQAPAHGTSIPWQSLETPQRPPMLPFFGNVKMWRLTPADLESIRPTPPPAIGSDSFNKDLKETAYYAQHPKEKMGIALYWADGVGTYTPSGHWNDIACQLIASAQYNLLRTARALSLLNMALHDAGVGCWNTKAYYYFPRPTQIDPNIKTIGLPNFPSYTSGHSTFSAAAASVLAYLFPSEKTHLDNMASEASASRVYGGIHYRFDCLAGLQHGKAIAQFTITQAQQDGAD